jgi:DNA-binding response OmpR family regulator
MSVDLKRIGQAARSLLGLIDRIPDELGPPAKPAPPAIPSPPRLAAPPAAAPPPAAKRPSAAAVPQFDDTPSPATMVIRAAATKHAEGTDKLLVVDDNELNRDMLSRRLKSRGYAVMTADDGPQCLDLVKGQRFDLILLDIMMPDVDGIQVLRQVREKSSGIELPVIMTTARADRRDIVNALELGANDYVTKPIDLPVLLARIRTQLALAGASRELGAAQQKILDLTASAASARHDVDSWSRATAAEISELLNADVDVVIGKREDETSVAVHETNPIAMRKPESDGDSIRIPVEAAGRHAGEVIIRRPFVTRDERVLVESFATQLGAAIEMRDLRWELTAARQRFYEQRKQMIDRGTVLLHVCSRCGRCYEHTVPS